MSDSRFIVFEGIDFSGKDTQLALLNKELSNSVILNTISKGLLGRRIREYLSNEVLPVDNLVMATMFTAELAMASDTVDHLLTKNNYVLANRWYYSTLAYNAFTFEERVEIEKMNTRAKKPDVVIYLDIDPVKAMDRKINRVGKNKEVFETVENLQQVYERYKVILDSPFDQSKIIIIDADQDTRDVQGDILKALSELGVRND